MQPDMEQRQVELYADLIVKIGINLQPEQSVSISGELGHAEFVRALAASAYKAGAKYVRVNWIDDPTSKARFLHSKPEYLDYFPAYEVATAHALLDEGWARISLTGATFPDLFDDVDPALMRRTQVARAQQMGFYMKAMMANQVQWCVAAVPTPAWARKVFPDLAADEALKKLWATVLQMVRADQPDPIAAWQAHDQKLRHITRLMAQHQVMSVHFFDPALADDGQPSTDLTIGLTDAPQWVAASSPRPDGVRFLPNMPTEEVFTTPHKARVNGYVRTSKPGFPFEREVRNAYFKFENGVVVDFRAEVGQDVLAQLMEMSGARQLGEVALVDVRSPINQSGLIFYDTLFDENAVCHIAFGRAYPEGVVGASELTDDELAAFGVNNSDAHEDLMIGTATMNVTGLCADGRTVEIMRNGEFVLA